MIDGRLDAHRVKEATTSAQNSRRDGKKGDSKYIFAAALRASQTSHGVV